MRVLQADKVHARVPAHEAPGARMDVRPLAAATASSLTSR
jgi:hypothetical protein